LAGFWRLAVIAAVNPSESGVCNTLASKPITGPLMARSFAATTVLKVRFHTITPIFAQIGVILLFGSFWYSLETRK
jgi:hypothetical protein